jgi:hypothetical protein
LLDYLIANLDQPARRRPIDFHGEMESAMEKLAVDKEFQKGVGEYNSASELSTPIRNYGDVFWPKLSD